MPATIKNQPAGPLHKLKSAFKEIFGKENDAPTSTDRGSDEKSDRSKEESTPR
jgi:hypothetical protein